MKFDFFKMQAQGNDYLFFDFLDKKIPAIDFSALSLKVCDRHFGVGADGIVLISADSENDAKMRIFNADGSEAEMCGTALRCVTSYLSQKLKKAEISVVTKAGIREGKLIFEGKNPNVKVGIGKPEILKQELKVEGFVGDWISVGNPHFVIFLEEENSGFKRNYARKFGKKIERNTYFPERTNVEFARIISSKTIEIQIWERGSGATLACGTGSVAAAFVGMRRKRLEKNVTVKVPGGEVKISVENGFFFLSGEVFKVFSGKIEI
ncbi:MAG: diaminopimelate epimerase [Candidatus Cloacimonas sp. 4484_275]|nr:MAG: diaminopimelate epimerase [Candidatus Cloacimonas sp. 4484_275]